LCVLCAFVTLFTLRSSELSLVGLALDVVDLTIVLQCCDTFDWVIWPVKSCRKWPIMCWVGLYTLLYLYL